MEPRLRNAIAKIEVRSGGDVTSRGTGTLVAEGLVLTALHVVGNRLSDPVEFLPGEILLTFPGHSTRAVPVDGMCHGGLDWALLRCEEPPRARPVPLGEISEAGGAWTTYGFPDAQPLDGMVQAGTVRNADARLNGEPTYQLFSEEAAAGRGAPVKGLSGGPVLVDGALVGVLRFALMREEQAVAGTLYACPARIAAEACDGQLPIPDPCHGLPGLPRLPLPEEPYRFLSRYREQDAEIFFGRNRDIRAVYEQVTGDDGMGVVLFYGQTGVGKSSFLDAGLVPRLRWTHNVRYLRREAHRSLLETLRGGLIAELGDGAAGDGVPLTELWRRAEEHGSKPVVVILDQVEEVYTRRHPDRADELIELGRALQDVFHGSQLPPGGQLVLGFRKEWYPEVQQRLEDCRVGFSRVFLETLREDGVAEAVAGLSRTQRLRDRYGLTVAAELPAVIAGQLHEDPDSPIAPTLQILLAKMWQTARADNAHAPAFTLDLYQRLKHEGALLGDFLDQQIRAMLVRRRTAVQSGLVLDVLARHTTPLLTADECSGASLEADYGHHDDFDGLLTDMQELYLLVDAGTDTAGGGTRSRLAHDTLAPLVRQRFDESARPGQAALRVLESRVPMGSVAADLVPLDEHDLETVEAGLPGMRRLGPIETQLVAASRAEREKRHRNRRRVRVGFLVLLGVLAFTSVLALNELRAATREREFTELSNTTDKVRSDLVSTPINGLILAFSAVCRSIEQDFPIANELQMSLSTALERARETQVLTLPAPINSIDTHPREPRFAAALENGEVHLMTRRGLRIGRPLLCYDVGQEPPPGRVDGHTPRAARRVTYSADGAWLYAAGNDGLLRAWQPGVPGAAVRTAEHGASIRSIAASPDGRHVATGGADGVIRIWLADVDATQHALRAPDQVGGVNALVFTAAGVLVSGGDDGVIRLWSLDDATARPCEIRRHEGPVLALATADSRGMGGLIASGGADQTVRVYHDDGRPLRTRNWRPGAEPEHELGANRREVVISDHTSAVRSVAFNGDGSYLLSGDEMGVVTLNDVLGQPAARPFLGPDAAVRSISYFPDDDALVASLDHHVRTRSPNGLMVGRDLRPLGAALSPDDPVMTCVAFSANGRFLAAGDATGWVTVWDHATRQSLHRLETPGTYPVGAAFIGSDLVAVACDDGTLRVFTKGAEPRDVLPAGAAIRALAGNPHGRLVVGDATGGVRIVDLDCEDEPVVVAESGSDVMAVAIAHDGRRLAVARGDSRPGAEDGKIELWSLGTTWTLTGELDHGDNHGLVHGLAFGGDVLFSAGADGKLRIRDIASGESLHPAQKAHFGVAYAVAASSDGKRVVTGGADGRVVLFGVDLNPSSGGGIWDLFSTPDKEPSVDRIAEFVPAHRWGVRAVAFGGEDERIAASASLDGSVRLWRAHIDLWLDAAAKRIRTNPPTGSSKNHRLVRTYLESPPWESRR